MLFMLFTRVHSCDHSLSSHGRVYPIASVQQRPPPVYLPELIGAGFVSVQP